MANPAQAQTALQSGLADFQAGRFGEAVEAWRRGADGGDERSALYLGALYDTGIGVAQDYAAALAWYKQAAANGSATGLFNVGVMYDAGRGVPRDPAEAASWYEKAAARGFGRAAYNLAQMYETGSGVARDRRRALDFYREAASDGIAAARTHLARVGQAYHGAVAAAPPDVFAEFEKAQAAFLARGPEAAANAVGLFRKAAEDGNALAQYDLGYCYEHGIGIAADPDEALRWYRTSARTAPEGPMRQIAEAGARSALSRTREVHR